MRVFLYLALINLIPDHAQAEKNLVENLCQGFSAKELACEMPCLNKYLAAIKATSLAQMADHQEFNRKALKCLSSSNDPGCQNYGREEIKKFLFGPIESRKKVFSAMRQSLGLRSDIAEITGSFSDWNLWSPDDKSLAEKKIRAEISHMTSDGARLEPLNRLEIRSATQTWNAEFAKRFFEKFPTAEEDTNIGCQQLEQFRTSHRGQVSQAIKEMADKEYAEILNHYPLFKFVSNLDHLDEELPNILRKIIANNDQASQEISDTQFSSKGFESSKAFSLHSIGTLPYFTAIQKNKNLLTTVESQNRFQKTVVLEACQGAKALSSRVTSSENWKKNVFMSSGLVALGGFVAAFGCGLVTAGIAAGACGSAAMLTISGSAILGGSAVGVVNAVTYGIGEQQQKSKLETQASSSAIKSLVNHEDLSQLQRSASETKLEGGLAATGLAGGGALSQGRGAFELGQSLYSIGSKIRTAVSQHGAKLDELAKTKSASASKNIISEKPPDWFREAIQKFRDPKASFESVRHLNDQVCAEIISKLKAQGFDAELRQFGGPGTGFEIHNAILVKTDKMSGNSPLAKAQKRFGTEFWISPFAETKNKFGGLFIPSKNQIILPFDSVFQNNLSGSQAFLHEVRHAYLNYLRVTEEQAPLSASLSVERSIGGRPLKLDGLYQDYVSAEEVSTYGRDYNRSRTLRDQATDQASKLQHQANMDFARDMVVRTSAEFRFHVNTLLRQIDNNPKSIMWTKGNPGLIAETTSDGVKLKIHLPTASNADSSEQLIAKLKNHLGDIKADFISAQARHTSTDLVPIIEQELASTLKIEKSILDESYAPDLIKRAQEQYPQTWEAELAKYRTKQLDDAHLHNRSVDFDYDGDRKLWTAKLDWGNPNPVRVEVPVTGYKPEASRKENLRALIASLKKQSELAQKVPVRKLEKASVTSDLEPMLNAQVAPKIGSILGGLRDGLKRQHFGQPYKPTTRIVFREYGEETKAIISFPNEVEELAISIKDAKSTDNVKQLKIKLINQLESLANPADKEEIARLKQLLQ